MAQQLKIREAEEVAKLGWVGNHAADLQRFTAVQEFIWARVGEDTPASWKEAKRALYLMGKHAMGISGRVTKKDVEGFVYGDSRR